LILTEKIFTLTNQLKTLNRRSLKIKHRSMQRLLSFATVMLALAFQPVIAQTPAATTAPRGGGQRRGNTTPPPVTAKPEELAKIREKTEQIEVLVKDLKARGLLDDTLVIWGGEFGRTPMVESNPSLGRSLGRDHHPSAFTIWMAGGGIRAGMTYGATDALGFHVVENQVHVHDLQATILRQLGLDHERLTFRYQGRDFRLTDVSGKVVEAILA
jgi:uncharacterized protein (DUF1501 family)